MNSFMKYLHVSLVAVIWMTLVACATDESTSLRANSSLYDRLGGKSAISGVVDEFVSNVAKDSRINSRFATTDIPRLKGHLVDQVCSASGGPCIYSGRDMSTTHAGMGITTAEFTALVEDLVAALKTFNVPEAEQQELLALLGSMKSDIIEIK